MKRNTAHFNNRGQTNYLCSHSQFKIDVKYRCSVKLPTKKGLDQFPEKLEE